MNIFFNIVLLLPIVAFMLFALGSMFIPEATVAPSEMRMYDHVEHD